MRLIDADTLNESLFDEMEATTPLEATIQYIIKLRINNAPTIDPVHHGQWSHERLISTSGGTYSVVRCSECLSQFPMWETNYCPNCGAKMDGEKDDEID